MIVYRNIRDVYSWPTCLAPLLQPKVSRPLAGKRANKVIYALDFRANVHTNDKKIFQMKTMKENHITPRET